LTRLLLSGFLVLLALACGDDSPYWTQAPKDRRSCGELDGVDPVPPVVVGEDDFGCPIFAPVPCTEPWESYHSLCGEGCRPRSAFSDEGDAWLIGCSAFIDVAACNDLEPPDQPLCVLDPFEGKPYWYFFSGSCSYVFIPLQCWDACDPDDETMPYGECGF
jgi:hypothetical protein